MTGKTAKWALGILVLAALSGCAAVTPGPSRAAGFDVLIAKDSTGQRLMVMPSTGIMLRDGSRESVDVQVHWTLAHDLERGRMMVFSADGARLLADVSVRDIAVQHRGAQSAGFAGAAVPAQPEQLAALADAP